ncbi:TIGR01244 family sulfur transferase [Neisseria wadsworthii]|uniref:TIGR01244 family sulfur transferase n=1 Tax=Neisseria wadsworthii TaxID=607711 RepID=UPI000D327466|nr:TIGR01244 family sulfur transferase [Neisseria wadsworthii]
MSFFQLTDKLYIAPQINRTDAADAAKLGITGVICNRPDQEEPDQPTFTEVSTWFADAGIRNITHQPVIGSQITESDAQTFAQTLAAHDGPVLAYCRTGTRCSLLWALHQAGQGKDVAPLISEIKEKTGLDLSNFTDKLQAANSAS